MAVHWRVEVESIEGMQSKPPSTEDTDVPGEFPKRNAVLRNVVIEVASGRAAAQRTKPVDVPSSSGVQLRKTLFVAPPSHGSGFVIRAIRVSGASPDALLGEAGLAPVLPGRRRIELTRGGEVILSLVLNVMQGAPSTSHPFEFATDVQQPPLGSHSISSSPPFAKSRWNGGPVPTEEAEDRTLPPGWRSRYDPSSKAFYYFRVDHQGVPDSGSVRWIKPAPASAELMAATAELRSGKITTRSTEIPGSPSSRSSQSPVFSGEPWPRISPTPSVASHSSSGTATGHRPLLGAAPSVLAGGQNQVQHQQHSRASPVKSSAVQGPSLQRGAASISAAFAAKAAAAIAREARIDQEFRDARPLSQRSPMMPIIGTCDATIEALEGLTPPLQNPRLILGLEGQEFRVDRRDLKVGPAHFTFPFASLGSNLLLLCYDCPEDGMEPCLVGRILLPLTDAVHPIGHPMGCSRILGDRCHEEPPLLTRRYRLQFLPGPLHDPQRGDPMFEDRFTSMHLAASLQAASTSGHTCGGSSHGNGGSCDIMGDKDAIKAGLCAFGSVILSLELALQPELAKPISLYWASVASGIQQAIRTDAPPNCAPWAPLCQSRPRSSCGFSTAADGMSTADAVHWFQSEGLPRLENIFQCLSRLVHFWVSPSQGWSRWLRSSWWHAPVTAAAWFFFCVSYFPPPLWTWPLYAWFYLLVDGLLAANHRRSDWLNGGSGAMERIDVEEGSVQRELKMLGMKSFARNPTYNDRTCREKEETAVDDGEEDSDTSSDVPTVHHVQPDFAREDSQWHALVRHVHRFEPLLANLAGFVERVANLVSFADGTASAIGYIVLSAMALFVSLVLMLVTWVDPSLGFAVGIDGAISILYLSRLPQEKPPEPFSLQRKVNQIMACVPDEAELIHRLVATRVQRLQGL